MPCGWSSCALGPQRQRHLNHFLEVVLHLVPVSGNVSCVLRRITRVRQAYKTGVDASLALAVNAAAH